MDLDETWEYSVLQISLFIIYFAFVVDGWDGMVAALMIVIFHCYQAKLKGLC